MQLATTIILPGPVDSPDIQPLIPDAHEAADAWHRRTGLYPISHLLVAKDATLDENEGLATELFGMFDEARSEYTCRLMSGDATEAWDQSVLKMAEIVGDDPIPYGYASSLKTLETFIGFNLEQGVIPEAVDPAELFVPETLSLGDSG